MDRIATEGQHGEHSLVPDVGVEAGEPWSWTYHGYDPADEGLRETLHAVGNGYLCTRGAAPETSADGTHYPGTYGGGIFNRLETAIEDPSGEGAANVPNESMVNLPNWLFTTFRIDGGPWFSLADVDIDDYEQRLDLRRGVLVRRVRFRDRDGRTTTLVQRRFVSMADRHVCVLTTSITPEDWDGRLEIRSALDGTVENKGVDRYLALRGDHLDVIGQSCTTGGDVSLEVMTNQSRILIAMAARHDTRVGGAPAELDVTEDCRPGWSGVDLAVDAQRGQAVNVDKIVTVFTSRDPAIAEPAEETRRWLERLPAASALLERHVRAWRQLWHRFAFDVESDGNGNGPEDGDSELLRVVRLHLFHVLCTASPNSCDLDAGIPPRGLHGEAYRGHILWDEVFVFPLLNVRLPAVTRSLLLYRYRRLPEARAAAAASGHRGAMFPWQSGSDGREENQTLHLNPASGRWIPDPTFRQRHVGLAIAYNVWRYFQATADRRFLVDHGAEMMFDIALFFSSLTEFDENRGRYVIRGVMGPDEFHSGYPGGPEEGVDNNAYTNVLAVWLFRRALQACEVMTPTRLAELHENLGIDADELDRWRDIAERMFVPFHDNGIISQFEGYENLAELPWDELKERHGDIHRLDRILEAEGDAVNNYKASKQADVLMLFFLLSPAELGDLFTGLSYEFDPEVIPRTIDYYLERSSHGSTLSAVVYSWVLTRAHREQGMELFWLALRSDIEDVQGGTTREGIHLAAMAGTVDLLQRCFAGLETRRDRLYVDPLWPAELGRLSFNIIYRGHPIAITVSGTEATVESTSVDAPGPITVVSRGETISLEPGSRHTFSAANERAKV